MMTYSDSMKMVVDTVTDTANSFIHMYPAYGIDVSVQTDFQKVEIVNSIPFGKVLYLDGDMQSTESDEFIYHEALVQPAMHLHRKPRNVLIIGGGEGATLREVLRHEVLKATMVDIDLQLIEICKKHLSQWHGGSFSDPRSVVISDDAFSYVKECKEKFDVIIVDLTDPSSDIASSAFSEKFYKSLRNLTTDGSICAFQIGNFWKKPQFHDILQLLRKSFGFAYPYKTYIPSFLAEWGFALASQKEIDMLNPFQILNTGKHYNRTTHSSMFAVSTF